MKFSKEARNRSVTLELTPLIDVMFLLLIFFLLTATYVKNPNIDIDLPRASSQEVFTKDNDLTVVIKKDGTYRFEDEEVTLAALEGIFRKRLAANGKDTVIIVKADKGAKHGKVVSAMDMAKRVGFSKLAIAVSAPVAESPR